MKKRILLVDDSVMVHEIFGSKLEEAGYEVLHAEDGFSAINVTLAAMPDLILLDIMMPVISGYQVCRLLKDRRGTSHIPIVFITGESSKHFAKDPMSWAFKTGADGYLEKADLDILIENIKPFLKNSMKNVDAGKAPSSMSEIEILSAISKLLDKQLYLDVKKLEDLDDRKDTFISNVAHELKSPLGIIKGNMQNLKLGIYGSVSDKQQDIFLSTERTVDRIARLVTDLLDISKIEAGEMHLNRSPISLPTFLNDILDDYVGELKEKNITIQKEFPSDISNVSGDRDRLVQVAVNLFSNAIKFTPQGGNITIRLKPDKDLVRVEIEDSGPGIAAEDLEKIFNKFERIGANKAEGSGLGLPIARNLVGLHGGKVWAESDGKNGSTFIFILPVK